MGISPFRHWLEEGPVPELRKDDPNPDPSRFEVKTVHVSQNYLVAQVTYEGCTNFEGEKILVFEGMNLGELSRKSLLDPHFSEKSKLIARFVPTQEGWKQAVLLVTTLEHARERGFL